MAPSSDNELEEADTIVDVVLKQRAELLTVIHEKASEKSKKADKQMIERHSAKNPPSIYTVGEEVLVKLTSKKWNKVRGKGISLPPSTVGKVVEVRPATNKYKVLVSVEDKTKAEWVCVSSLTSLTRADDKMREKEESTQLPGCSGYT